MGEVYLPRDKTELERVVAIKLLLAEIAFDSEPMRRGNYNRIRWLL